MKKIISATLIFSIFVTISCCGLNNGKSDQPTSTQVNKNYAQPTKPLNKIDSDTTSLKLNFSLTDFKGIPKDIDGCSCYFSETIQKFKIREYLFASSYDSIGFVSINNKLIKLKLTSTGREPNSFGDNDHIDIYNSELYKVTVDIKYKKTNGEETWWNDGTITIENKQGKKIIKKFVGECGC